ncbi:ATP synthase subunit delta [Mactra antiquata]
MSLSRQFLRVPRLLSQCQRLSAVSQQRCHESTAGENLLLTFLSPSDVYYKDQIVKQVDVPAMNCTFGILKQHVPTISVLKPGVVTVHDDDGTTKYFVSSGSVTVNADSTVQILAEEAHPLDRFDNESVKESVDAAQNRMKSATTDAEKTEAQIAIDCLEVLSKSLSA